jgi:hypothetical protein
VDVTKSARQGSNPFRLASVKRREVKRWQNIYEFCYISILFIYENFIAIMYTCVGRTRYLAAFESVCADTPAEG